MWRNEEERFSSIDFFIENDKAPDEMLL